MVRRRIVWTENWKFIKEDIGAAKVSSAEGERVNLPHTWNAEDGQDGGNDYYRGKCWYVKELTGITVEENEELWIEFCGAAMMAEVFVNGVLAGSHAGGYSTFRINLTHYLKEKNVIAVSVDNSEVRTVYPQKADFTFYGGIYRSVYLITVPKSHFSLGYFGGPGLKVTPIVKLPEERCNGRDVSDLQGSRAEVEMEAWTENGPEQSVVKYTVLDADKNRIAETETVLTRNHSSAKLIIENVHLWDGIKDPYLYTLQAELESGDQVELPFGCRSFQIDPEKGFILNGKSYRLCGAARHQDRQGVGNALTKEMHEEDMQILREMGANTVRMAHYQHDQYFYDLADRHGMIVWAEIPYITEHMPEAKENSLTQMTELIIQNYHHPSIVCWALSNEITTTGGVTEDLIENHKKLNDLCHLLDRIRPTSMAHVFMLDPDDALVTLPDIRSFNLYYGWYLGEAGDNDIWFDDFHRKHPDTVIGLSEYGADANPQYQSANPEKGDYTEGYQAIYHEHMLEMWRKRPYIWAMHVWNMFDFGADGREEGGKPGQNQKGLVTFDRKLRKDAFYIYKAYLSDEPFVHLCGRRYADRTEKETEIKVYSNQKEVVLYVDGKEMERQTGDKAFRFRIRISGTHQIEARSGELRDTMEICYVKEPNPAYICPGREVVNWFDREDEIIKAGYFSILDSMGEVKAHAKASKVLEEMMAPLQEQAAAAYGDVAKNVQMTPEMQAMMDRMSVEQSLKQMGKLVKPEFVHRLNSVLNQIKK